MKPFELKATILSLSMISSVTTAGAAETVFSSNELSGQKAYDQHQYKKAETSLLKALDAAVSEQTKDLEIARAHVLLAKVYRESARPQKANEQLDIALSIYKKLGFVEPVCADERTQLLKEYKQVDPGALGQGYESLKNNSAVISIQKKESGAHVEFTMPAPMEKTLNSQKVDGLQLEALVSFDLATTGDGKVHASNIKGFKIHSVEKNTWANLLDLTVGGPANAEGTYDATIVAGKGGFSKTVAAKLPEKAYQPVKSIADQIGRFDFAPVLDIPIAAAPADATLTAIPAAESVVVPATMGATIPTAAITPAAAITPTADPASSSSSSVSTAPSWTETKTRSKMKNTAVGPASAPPSTDLSVSGNTSVSTNAPEVVPPKIETTTTPTNPPASTSASPVVADPGQTKVETVNVKSKHDDDDDDDDKEDAARRQRRREARQARRAAEDAKEAAEEAAEKLDDAKKREKENAKDRDKDDDDKNDRDKKDKD